MATKRMLSLKIIDTDAFLDMPVSTQLLYFHLTMRADDEGFVDSPKRIMKLIGVADDDLKILIAKRFILTFESGIIVIKHWLIHNTIRMDRFNKTNYADEKNKLAIKKNSAYTEVEKINGKEIFEIESRNKNKNNWQEKRRIAYKNSNLPDSFSYKIRQAFYGKPCPICDCEMKRYEFYDNKKPTIQHNKPISKGGKHEINNISVICNECNTSLQGKETDELNNKEVIEAWNTIGILSATNDGHKLSKVKLSKAKLSEVTPSQFAKEFFENIEAQEKIAKNISEKYNSDLGNIKNQINLFISYWTEPNKSGTKERWQLQQTFDVKRRLITWLNRSKEFNNNKGTQSL